MDLVGKKEKKWIGNGRNLILNFKFWILNSEFWISYSEFWTWILNFDLNSEIWTFEIWNFNMNISGTKEDFDMNISGTKKDFDMRFFPSGLYCLLSLTFWAKMSKNVIVSWVLYFLVQIAYKKIGLCHFFPIIIVFNFMQRIGPK